MNFYLTAILLGLGFSSLALGIYISMRIFNIPDITTDGSFTLGGAVTAVLISTYSPLLILPVVFLAGAFAGGLTGLINTRLKVHPLLSGILVMTSLYSVNLAVMGRSNIPLTDTSNLLESLDFISEKNSSLFILSLFIFLLWFLLKRLLKTDFGLAMRATGNNVEMIRAMGVNSDRMKITGLAIANGLTALSGYLVVQIQGFADINMGIGIVILGLGAVMIGEILSALIKNKSVGISIFFVIAGSIIFRLILAFALDIGVDPLYLKLVVSVFVLIVVSIPALSKKNFTI